MVAKYARNCWIFPGCFRTAIAAYVQKHITPASCSHETVPSSLELLGGRWRVLSSILSGKLYIVWQKFCYVKCSIFVTNFSGITMPKRKALNRQYGDSRSYPGYPSP